MKIIYHNDRFRGDEEPHWIHEFQMFIIYPHDHEYAGYII